VKCGHCAKDAPCPARGYGPLAIPRQEVEQRPKHAGRHEARALKSARQRAPRNGRAVAAIVPSADRLARPSCGPPIQTARVATGRGRTDSPRCARLADSAAAGRPAGKEGRPATPGLLPRCSGPRPKTARSSRALGEPSPGSLAPPSGKHSAKSASSVLRHARSAASGAPCPRLSLGSGPRSSAPLLRAIRVIAAIFLIRALLEAAGKPGPLQLRCARQKPPRSAPLRKKPNAVAVNPFPFAPQGCRSA
jgi:hypothetical protein